MSDTTKTPRTDAIRYMSLLPAGASKKMLDKIIELSCQLESENASLRKTIKALKNPNRCPNCHVAYTPKTCTKPCRGPGGAFPCDYPKCVGK